MALWQKVRDLFTNKKNGSNSDNIKLGKKTENKKGLRWRLKRLYAPKADMQIAKWEQAIIIAKSPDMPQRYYLYLLYTWAMLDSHLFSQIRTAHVTVQRSSFEVHKNKKIDEGLTDLFKRPWFIQYLKHALDSEFWGYSLVEFDPKMENGEFTKIYLIEREHVRPETSEVLLMPTDSQGICYTNKPFNKWLIGIGDPFDLGLLELATREVIWKNYSRRDWSIRSEKFGMPFIIIKTSSSDEVELDRKEEMAAGFGANGYAILDDQDEFDLVESKNASGHDIYKDKAEYCDKEISKLINGQTGTADEKSFVGSAEVHERILNDYGFARLTSIEYHINFELFPFLEKHGYKLSGSTFKFSDLMNKPKQKENTTEEKKEEKKKLNKTHLTNIYSYYISKKDLFTAIALTVDLDKLIKSTTRKVHSQKLKEGDADADTWLENVQELWDGTQDGMNQAFVNTKYSDPAFELMASFRNNIQVFAAFKSHQEISDLVGLLKDESGATRSFSDFKIEAEPIIGQYNDQYLQAEYNHAVAASQSADKWLEFEENKDVFPNLRYTTQNDERVRDAHAELDGITLPLEHEFWDSFITPIDWGCRCITRQVNASQEITKESDLPSLEQVPAVFRNNPARTGELYTDSHPYFEGMDANTAENIVMQKNQFVYDTFPSNEFKKLLFDKKTGGYAVKSKKHKKKSQDNEKTAKELAKQGNGIELVKTGKNAPDAIWDGKVWSFKHLETKEGVQAAIKEGAKQANRVLLVFDETDNLDINDAIGQAVEGTGITEVGILNGKDLDFIITE